MRLEVWRCLRQLRSSSSSIDSMKARCSSSFDGRCLLTGTAGERLSILRYLRTVGSDTPVLRAMSAMVSPSRRNLRIE